MMDHVIKNDRPAKFRFATGFFLAIFTLVLGTALAITGCSEKEKPKPPRPTVPVKTAQAVQKDVPVQLFANGAVEARQVVNIKSRVEGQVMEIHIREGQEITKGQAMVSIDDRPYQALLEAAAANLSRDRIRWEKAKKDSVRYSELLRKDYVTRAQAEQVQADAESLEAVVRADEAALDNAKLNVSFCNIPAPVSGRAGDILIDVGNMVRPGDANPMVVIHQIQPVYVRFSIPENRLQEVRAQMQKHDLTALATPPGEQSEAMEGKLTFLDNTINRGTGTIALKAVFDNPDKRLWPGQFVDVLLILESRPGVVVVPSAAVQTGQDGNYVFVVKPDSTAELRPVTTGNQTNGDIVVEKGLAVGETVVTDGHVMLRPGAKIAVKNNPQPNGDAPK
ncbi:MAG: efflux RND transporter periplasmic adaptor subunit [Desulfobacteraceae bacterium]|nr:efflux RND transporter periplasmic adaptor subunit [Desulfobacteraceae bacterium]MBU4055431.1 efflux RND transporter periplasmic adaptor subunit [Pseudomonadota bacterium]